MRLAIDAMGGDLGPRATVWGTAEALLEHSEIEACLCGPREMLETELLQLPRRFKHAVRRMTLRHASHVIAQDMKPSSALRESADSSLSSMLDEVACGKAAAGVSAGNTGALMALSRRALGMVAGMPRPAISTAVPTRNGGRCYLLDIGANVEASAQRLTEFALMGEVMARRVDGVSRPRVALLNVGIEATKGTASVRQADACLREIPQLNYVGFVEGNGLFDGSADVVICDGFVGNIVLKASEGLAGMLVERVQATFAAHWGSRLVSLLARPAMLRVKRQLDPVRYNGASLLGLSGIVIKSHGRADSRGFAYAVSRAVQEVRMDLPRHLEHELGHWSATPSVACGQRNSGFSTRSKPDDFNSQR